MSAKLIVHKFEEGIKFKFLYISIENDISETTFSDWLDGTSEQKRKSSDSSRLTIKVVSGSELRYIDLDSCSKEISKSNIYPRNGRDWLNCSYELDKIKKTSPENFTIPNNDDFKYHGLLKTTLNGNITNHHTHEIVNNLSPLEYSLEKVKENNARIMENIHMLNRTLSYTKKKEILNVTWPCSKSMKTYSCNVCGKHFVYITGLKRHYAMRHVMVESQQQWQIVWTCTECFQVWPHQYLAFNHSGKCGKGDSTDCIHEIKTSSLLQCEFCDKVFTSIPRLLRHSKIHTIASNYECNACNMSFQSYKSAEQHWLFCPWSHTCYRFSLPKLLLCNACDRKFRNYEQLYNHRYKVGHFMTKLKTECDGKSPYLVYQCEICGDWFQSTTLLQTHHKNHIQPPYDFGVICKTETTT